MIQKIDYRDYYDLEYRLFPKINEKVTNKIPLNALEFFSILIWKANRAKSKHAERLLKKSKDKNLEEISIEITSNIYAKENKKTRLKYLIEDWKFYLPTATAILAIMYPTDFTIYDIRACQALNISDKDYNRLANKNTFDEKMWEDYESFENRVMNDVIGETLRDKDRYLWGKSFYTDLENDIKTKFERFKKK